MALCVTSALSVRAAAPRISSEDKVRLAPPPRPPTRSIEPNRGLRIGLRARRRREASSLSSPPPDPRVASLDRIVPQTAPAPLHRRVASALGASALALSLTLATPTSSRAEIRLPPVDPDPDRCERAFVGNTIGQANAVSDRILDLRKCEYDGKDLSTKTLSGALMVDASFKGTNLTEVVMSKAYALNADFTGANFTNAVVDRVTFDGANLANADFHNAVITGTTYEGTDLTGATFEEALIGKEDVKRLCDNPTVKGPTRFEVGCRD